MVSKPVFEPKAQDVRIESVTMKIHIVGGNKHKLSNVNKPEGVEEKIQIKATKLQIQS